MTEGKKEKLKSLIGFRSANKINNYSIGGRKGKKSKLFYRTKHKNNKCFSWVSAVRVLSLAGSHSPPHLPRMPSSTVLISGPALGAAQIPVWSYSCVFVPPMSTAIWTSAFSFVGALHGFYIFHRHRDCLVDCVDLICSLYGWWEGLGSSSLATLPLGFFCGFISTSACGSTSGVCSEAALEDLGLPLWGPGVEVVQLLGSQGFWQHQVLRGAGG